MEKKEKLNRTLKLHECIFYGVGSILGAGIYTIIGKVAGLSGNMLWLAFAIASFSALMTAFSYAELSSVFPAAGAEYTYVKNTFNKKIAIIIGFAVIGSGIVSGATVAIGFAGYLSQFLGLGNFLSAAGIIILIFYINASGIKQSSTVNIIFTIIEFGGLAFVIYTAITQIGKVNYTEMPPQGINGLLMATALSYFAFLGFEEIVKLGDETINPEKNIPRALIISCLIVTVIYIIISLCAVSVIPYRELSKSESPLADIVKTKFGEIGVIIISAVALFSTSNTILSNLLGASRVMYYLSEENRFLRFFSYVLPRTKTPVFALIIICLIMIGFTAIGKIEKVALIANFFIFSTFLLVNISAIIFRIKEPEKERPYKIPFNIGNIPLTSILGIAFTLLLICYSVYALVAGVSVG